MQIDPGVAPNVGSAFTARAAADPLRPALIFHRGAEPALEIGYAELDRRARWRAADLTRRFSPGERVMIALPSCPEFVELYLGCLFAGLIAVPAPPPTRSATAASRVSAIAADCEPAIVYAHSADHAALAENLPASVGVEEPPQITSGPPPGPAPAEPERADLAVLQYSSGSTGAPNGVMLAHGDVLDNFAVFARDMRMGPADVFGGWIPLHHDMGLFALLTTGLLSGAGMALMHPTEFVRRPAEYFRMLTRHAVTVTAGPDFAFDLACRVLDDEVLEEFDLSHVRILLNGSEPINAATMDRFAARFARTGLRAEAMVPAYGMAECTVYATCKEPGTPTTRIEADVAHLESTRSPRLHPAAQSPGRTFVGHGPFLRSRARIVDHETRRELADGEVGEIWLRSPGIGRGYWNRPEKTEAVFGARLVPDPDAASAAEQDTARYLRTGDLGAFVDGQLYITGRIKELMIVHGRNLYPQDLEREARAAHEALTGLPGAAFGVAVPDERVVLVHEVGSNVTAEQLPGIANAVTGALASTVGSPLRNLVLVRRGGVLRTTSGKIQRGATREKFLAGEIPAVYTRLEPAVRALAGKGSDV
jgi:acyl-CoA synthetase (AMP-forming)/AMP-acid ligase II